MASDPPDSGKKAAPPAPPAKPKGKPRTPEPSGFDPIAQPHVFEDESDSALHRFEALLKGERSEFDSTQSSLHVPLNNENWSPTQPGLLPGRGKWRLQLEADVGEVLALARRKNRAAPIARAWEAFHRLLPLAEQGGRNHSAPPPLPPDQSTPMQRRLRLRDQIEWAEVAGTLREAHAFLSGLSDAEWTYFDGAG